MSGFCAVCPNGLVLSTNNECKCPAGRKYENGKCKDICQPGQIADKFGYCYECPLKEVAVNGRCECKDNYERVGGVCTLSCNFISIPGTDLCAKCALGTQFDAKIGACVCGSGFYKGPGEEYFPLGH